VHRNHRHAATVGLLLGAFAAAPGAAHAAAFALREGSADWMANAYAGDTAKAYDASTVWSNPAGMVRLDRSEIDGSLNGIFPDLRFKGANFVGPTATTPGTTGGNLIQSAATGGQYGVWSFSPDLKFGFGVDAPFGQRVTNPGNFVGRYQSIVSSVTDIAVTVAAAYRINEQFSIGGGPVIDYFSNRSTLALNTGPTAALTGDPRADVRGQDYGVGFNIGILYQATPDLRFGLDYRSRIDHGVSGKQSFTVPALIARFSPVTAGLIAAQNSDANFKFTLPDNVTFGAYWQVTPQLALLSDVEWTDWSVFKSVNVVPSTPGLPSTLTVENFRNSWSVSIGANYRLTDKLMLQTGVGYDESPVKTQSRTSRIPDSDRYEIGIGAQYDVLPNLTLQVAYSHIFFDSAPINTTANATSGALIGTYTTSANTGSVGVKYKF
jgi:long-chain fatty acid transport protein